MVALPNTVPAGELDNSGPLLAAQANEHPAGYTTASHSHARAQLLYAVRGVMRVLTDVGRWVVPSGQAVWIPPHLPHEVRCLGAVSMRSLYLRTDAGQTLGLQLLRECKVVDVSGLLRELVVRACELADRGEPAGEALIRLTIEELAQMDAAPLELPLPTDPRLIAVTDALRKDPSDRRGLADWGHQVGASERTLARLFVSQTGITFGAWRQRLSVHVAVARLDAGDLVSEIALDLGYTSPSTFVAMFKRILGQPPGKYARRAATARLQYT